MQWYDSKIGTQLDPVGQNESLSIITGSIGIGLSVIFTVGIIPAFGIAVQMQ